MMTKMTNVTPLRPSRAPHLDSQNVAIGQVWRLQSQPRDTIIDETIDHLMTCHDMTEHAAENAAMQALAEIETLNTTDTIDISATTSRLLVFRGRGGSRIALTVADIRRLLHGQDLQAGNKVSGRLLLLS